MCSVCFPTDKPSAPENLQVSAMTENSISLRWSEPSDNGGCLISQYVIEKREGNKRTWQRDGAVSDTEFTSIALTAGQSYSFQVAAENEVGVGPFVELPKSVIPKSQFGKGFCCLSIILSVFSSYVMFLSTASYTYVVLYNIS